MAEQAEPTGPSATEKHYSPDEIAERWGLSRDSIIRLFRSERDVLRLTRPGTSKKRAYTTLRIPENVMDRVYRRMTNTGGHDAE